MSFNSKHGDNSNADESNAKTKAKVDRVYNNYNLFFILERELLLQSNNAGSASASSLSSSKNNGNGVRIPNEDYTDLTIPPLPSRYASLTLPPHWYVHGERQKRQHKKSHGVVSFREMAALIANYWKSVDGETLAFLEAVSKVLKQRQEEIRKRKAEEQDQKTPASSSRRRRLSVQTDVCDEEDACDEEDQKMPSSNYGYEYDTSRYFSSDGMTRRASNVYDAYGRSHSAESYGYYQHHRQLHRHQERDMSYESHSYEWPHPHSAHGSMSNSFETSLSQSGSGVSRSGVNECPLGMNADIASIAPLIMKRRDDLMDAWKLPVSHSKAQDIVTLADETTVVSDETATANANVDYPSLTDVAEVSITLCQVITHDSLSSHLEKLRRQEQKKGNEGSRNLDKLSFASMGDVSFASIEDLSFSSSSLLVREDGIKEVDMTDDEIIALW
jgi:hypothetical protein